MSVFKQDSTFRWMDNPDISQQGLMRDLRRHGVRLYGTRWCLNCRQQKAMLYHLAPQTGWKDMYVDCDLLLNSLETAHIKQVPAWKVGSEYHLGMQSEETLRALVDKVGGQKKQWKTGGAAQWQRRHRQRAAWAKQEYALLVREAIARGKAAAAASKATRSIAPPLAEMHPPQPSPHSPAALSHPLALPQVTAVTAAGRPGPLEAEEDTETVAGPKTIPGLLPPLPSSQLAVSHPQLSTRSKPPTPEPSRDQLRLRTPTFPSLHERIPILARWKERRTWNRSEAGREQAQGAQEAGPLAPLGWFRDRFTDTDYGQLFETVAKIRLLSLPQLLVMPRLLKPAFARASSAVEPGPIVPRRTAQEDTAGTRKGIPANQSWWRKDGSLPGWDTPWSHKSARSEGSGRASSREDTGRNRRRPWWQAIFSR